MVTPDVNTAPADEITYCEVHPDRETGLRCNKCGRYMCVDCAVQTPVGYRCKQCVRGIEDKFFNASGNDYLIIAGVCAALGGVAGAVMSAIGGGFLLFVLILGLPVGGGIAEIALRTVQRRRGRHSGYVAAGATAIGGLLGGMAQTYLALSNAYNQALAQLPANARADVPPLSLDFVFSRVFSDFTLLIFVGLVAFAVYGRFKMRM